MSPRRIVPILVALAAVAGCKNVTQEAPASELVIATFDSEVGLIPTPSDLALNGSAAMPASNQQMLLQWFVQGGGFPADQGVAISVPLNRWTWSDGANAYVRDQDAATQPIIDPTTVATNGATPNVIVLKVDGGQVVAQEIQLDAENSVSALSFTPPPAGSPLPGTIVSSKLQVHKVADANGSRRWAPGRYVFAVRGGAAGPKTCVGVCTAGAPRLSLTPDKPLALVEPNLDLTNPKNQPVMKLSPAQIAQLEGVRKSLWLPMTWGSAFDATNNVYTWSPTGVSTSVTPAFNAVTAATGWALADIAAIGTFQIAPPAPTMSVDSDSGIVPLPFDLARTGPAGASGAKTIGYNTAFGPAAAGLTTLDGFSTTAMIFAPASIPLDASTVNPSTVYLLKKVSGSWTMNPSLIAIEPDAITTTAGNQVAAGYPCTTARCSVIVGLQPAVSAGPYVFPPLDEATDYAVVITTGVKTMPLPVGPGGALVSLPVGRTAMAKLLLETPNDQNHLFWATLPTNGLTTSSLSGVSLPTAQALQTMRGQLRFDASNVVSTYVAATGNATSSIAMAYTFRTQSVTGTSLQLSMAPFANGAGVADPGALTTMNTAEASAGYGVPLTVLSAPSIQELAEVKITTTNLLLGSQNSGAFDPAHPTTEVMTALVVIPNPALVTGACPDPSYAATTPAATHCAPLVVFEHGITSSKANVLPLAAALAAKGFVVAAIDQMMQGQRSYCSDRVNGALVPNGGCAAGSTCNYKANLTTPVDLWDPTNPASIIQIGICESSPGVRGLLAGASPKGTPLLSGNRLLTMNFFRLRDAFRQDVIDQAALMKAIAPIGAGTDSFATYLRSAYGIGVDWSKIYLVGHSGGAINAGMTLAVNPRVTRAVTYAPGATFTDIAGNPDSSFHALLTAMLPAGSGEGTTGYMKLLQVAKWILDPSDPANYLRYVVPGHNAAGYPPSPFAVAAAQNPSNAGLAALAGIYPTQPTRDLLVQLSVCDPTVPNAQNLNYSGQAGLAAPATPGTTSTGRVQWYSLTGAATCPADRVTHSNIIDFANPSLTTKAQGTAADFLQTPVDVTTPVLP
jgi:dienelactone hydrolase